MTTPAPVRYDPQRHRLGKRPTRTHPRTLLLANYLDQDALELSSVLTGALVENWKTFANDRLQNAPVATVGHVLQIWDADATDPPPIDDEDLLAIFHAASGGTDDGADLLTVLDHWRTDGIAGSRLYAYAAVDPTVPQQVRAAIDLCGACIVGLRLPTTAQAQIGNLWGVPSGRRTAAGAPGSWGGFAMALTGYVGTRYSGVAWGAEQWLSEAFLAAFADEAYAPFDASWMDTPPATAPRGLDLARLRDDVAAAQPPTDAGTTPTPALPATPAAPIPGDAPSAPTAPAAAATGDNPVPTLLGIVPGIIPRYTPPQQGDLYGDFFVDGAFATIGGIVYPMTLLSPQQGSVQLPMYEQIGHLSVIVTNPPPGGGASNTARLEVAGTDTARDATVPLKEWQPNAWNFYTQTSDPAWLGIIGDTDTTWSAWVLSLTDDQLSGVEPLPPYPDLPPIPPPPTLDVGVAPLDPSPP